jgi:hypothetical protein
MMHLVCYLSHPDKVFETCIRAPSDLGTRAAQNNPYAWAVTTAPRGRKPAHNGG